MDVNLQSLHINSIIRIARCPKCSSNPLFSLEDSVECKVCNCRFPVKGYAADFVDEKAYDGFRPEDQYIYKRSLENWGESLHAKGLDDIPDSWHSSQFLEIFGDKKNIYRGTILEIGCGAGIDSRLIASRYPDRSYYALDIGTNIPVLAIRDRYLANLHYIRGDCLNLPVMDNSVNSVVSYGVFHHTTDPHKCMHEVFRVLKNNGSICIYLYKNHEDNVLKHFGVQAEKILMLLLSRMSIRAGRIFCWCISPVVLLLFSWPAQIMKRIGRLKRIGQSFPLHWGTVPSTVIDDLQDRLLASVNHRFSRKEFEALFLSSGFSNVEAVTTPAGHFGSAEKIL